MADWTQNYNGTPAPLVVGDLVISSMPAATKVCVVFLLPMMSTMVMKLWRRWTRSSARRRSVPKPGAAMLILHGAGATWMTGLARS